MKQQSDENNIPKHWQVKKLGEVCDKISLNKIKIKQKDYLSAGKFPVIDQGQDLIGGYFNDESLLVPSEPPYIIFGDHTKIKKFVNFKFVPGADGVKVLKPHSCFDPKFFFYLIHTVKIPDKGYARHFQFLEKEDIPIPPLPEQLAIVSKIEELLSDLENGKQQLLTAQQQLKVYRQSLLKAAFTSTTLSDRNTILKDYILKDVTHKIQIGPFGTQLHKEDYIENGVPLINPMHIQDGKIEANFSYSIKEEKRNSLPNYILEEGDVIMGRRGEMGRCGFVTNKEKGWFCGTGSLYFRPLKEKLNSRFLFYYLTSQPIKKYLNDNAGGTTMANLNLKIVNEIPISLPSLKEQQQIVEILESKLTVCDKIEETISQSLLQAEALKQSILKKAFEGKLLN